MDRKEKKGQRKRLGRKEEGRRSRGKENKWKRKEKGKRRKVRGIVYLREREREWEIKEDKESGRENK